MSSEQTAPSSSADGVRWDLTDLYNGENDPRIDKDLDTADALATKFADRYRGKIGSLGAGKLAGAVSELEGIVELADAPVLFAQLLHAAKSDDAARGRLVAHVSERNSAVRNKLVFFELEWVALDDPAADKLLGSAETASYRHYLERERRFKPHRLSEPEEMLLEQKANTGSRAFTRLFDELTGRLTCDVEIDGEIRRLNESETLALLYEPDRNTRRAAAEGMTATLKEQSHLLTYVMNVLVQDHKVDDTLRDYPSAMAARNLSNEIEQKYVDALITSCVDAYPTVQRYYGLKQRLLGYEELYDYDRYAPIAAEAPKLDWESCKRIVRDGYASFSAEAAQIVGKFFAGNWIDAELRSGQARRGVQRQRSDARAPVHSHQLHRQASGRDDRGPRVGARHPPIPISRGRLSAARHAADDRRDGVGVRRNDHISPPAGAGGRHESAPVSAHRED